MALNRFVSSVITAGGANSRQYDCAGTGPLPRLSFAARRPWLASSSVKPITLPLQSTLSSLPGLSSAFEHGPLPLNL